MSTSEDDPRAHIPSGFRSRAKHTSRLLGSLGKAGLKRLVRKNEEDDLALGDALVRELDQMKGMAMKVGQILSYMDVPLPAATQAALTRLQEGAAPLDFTALRPLIEDALGAPIDALFEELDPTPVAAASIGQVHRGTYQGRPVAVKVQYPGVMASFDSDMNQLGRLSKLASLAAGVDGPAIVEELHARLKEECDYLQEARSQEAFAAAWAGDPEVTIPAVFPERCATTVLTTAWEQGRSFNDLCAKGSQAERDRVGAILARFAWRSFFVHHAINADPHPGNYRFPAGDAVVFLDFGCVRRFDPEFVAAFKALFQAVLQGDRPAFAAATRRTGMVRTPRFDYDAHFTLIRYSLEPYLSPDFAFSPEYAQRGRALTGPNQANARSMDIPPPWIWLARLQFGLHAVLTRLDARGDFGAILRGALQDLPRPLSIALETP